MGLRANVWASGAAAVVVGLAGLACGGEPPSMGDSGPPIHSDAAVVSTHRVELGTGQTSFVPITEENSPMELVAGFQGGFHLDVTARLHDMPVDGLVLRYEVRNLDGDVRSLPARYALQGSRLTRDGDAWVRVGDFVQLDVVTASEVIGQTMIVSVEADPLGRLEPVVDEWTVTIIDDVP